MPQVNLPEWNTFFASYPDAHILQSGQWGELKSGFGWEAVRVINGEAGAQVLFRRLPLGLSFAYIPKGPLGPETCSAALWSELDDLCRLRRAVFLKVENDRWYSVQESAPAAPPPGTVFSLQHIQPHNTLIIDLQGSEEDVFNRMKPKTRYNIRLAGRKEVAVRVSNDIEDYYRIMNVTSQREQFHVHSLAYYRRAYELFHPAGMCELFVAEYQGRTLAAVMVFACGGSGYYFYGASSNEERNRKPTYPLQWEAIRWAHGKGCREYDMWGIPDEAADVDEDEAEGREDGLWGVYRFKRGFGGAIHRAAPTLDRVYNPLFYKLYQLRFSGSSSD